MAGKVFISYRRAGNPKDALLVFNHLKEKLGHPHVFMDVRGIRPGDDFVEVLEQQLADCTVLLALIGPDWLQVKDAQGLRRLDDEDDFVRVEIRTALNKAGMRVVPVLLDGAPMPRKADLPEDLQRLTRRQGLPVNAADPHAFDSATGRLLEVLLETLALQTHTPQTSAKPPVSPPPAPKHALPSWVHRADKDDIGRWFEFKLKDAVHSMGWIEAGSFWMGSPEAEKERYDDELRHRVTLSQGFWMADTACTQALWQAVMGDNPSNFTGDAQLPVESVSWNDIQQRFLPAANRLLPGLNLRLPTEAEWEYACRAGSERPFHFGSQVAPAQANYDGNYPYAGGTKGEYRQKTLPVKSFLPNDWGLYQMHGNVWEWCADGYGPYGAGEVRDPKGVDTAASRVLRGGSWGSVARYLRAADRSHLVPDVRGYGVGFRVCRSSPIE